MHALQARGFGDHELVLQKTLLAIQAVPLPDAVQRIKEALVVDPLFGFGLAHALVVQVVERLHRGLIEQGGGHIQGDAEAVLAR